MRAPSRQVALFRRVDRYIDSHFPDQIQFLQTLVRADSVNSFPPESSVRNKAVEQRVAKLIYDHLRSAGLTPKRLGVSQYRPNVICSVGPKRFRKSLIFNGHMDTAVVADGWTIDPFAATIRDRRLYGLGVLDMKATLSAYIFAVQALVSLGISFDGKLLLLFVVDSANGGASSYGTGYLMRKGIRAKAAILGEPGTGKIAIGHRGGYRFRLTTIGETVHVGRSAWERKEKGRNAILDMSRVAVALQEMELPYKPARAFPGREPVFTFPTKISGGASSTMVPDRCVAEGDVRLMPGNSDRQVRLWIEDCLRTRCPDVVYELEDLVYVPSVEISKSEEVVERLFYHATEVLGRKPKIAGAGPWNDAWMMITRDVPTVAGFGPDGDNAHHADEYVELDSLRAVTKIYARTVIEYLGVNS